MFTEVHDVLQDVPKIFGDFLVFETLAKRSVPLSPPSSGPKNPRMLRIRPFFKKKERQPSSDEIAMYFSLLYRSLEVVILCKTLGGEWSGTVEVHSSPFPSGGNQ